jgi:hypothetical protein
MVSYTDYLLLNEKYRFILNWEMGSIRKEVITENHNWVVITWPESHIVKCSNTKQES